MSWFCLYCPQTDPFPAEDTALDVCDSRQKAMPLYLILKGMNKGTVMYKVRSADRWYRRKYKVDIQNMRLSYTPSSKPFWRGKITTVDLFNLEEVRKGWNSDVFNLLEEKFRRKLQARLHPQLRSMLKEENCFSLIIGPAHFVVDLIAPNVHVRDAWVRGLRHVIACCKHVEYEHDEERWLKDHVRKADVNGNGSLNFEECLGLLQQLNISMRRREAKDLFNAANFRKVKIDGEDALEPDEFVHFYRSLVHRPELEEIMKKYSVNKSSLWGSEELRNFLQEEQNMSTNIAECEAFIEENEPEENKIPGYLSLEGFQRLMLSVEQNIFNKKHRIIYQNMNQPLTHYYIASSHNTYLIGGQLIGDSSIEGYIKALMRGCRCLELDTWDGPDGEPIIFHGYTMTSRIFLRDVLEAIKKYAFRASQYPIILSIENHCSLPYQIQMARHFEDILGEYLHKEPITEDETYLPSPEALARKILIKGKKLKEQHSLDGVLMSPGYFMLEEEEEREEAMAAAMSAPMPTKDDDNSETTLAAIPGDTSNEQQNVKSNISSADNVALIEGGSNENASGSPMAGPTPTDFNDGMGITLPMAGPTPTDFNDGMEIPLPMAAPAHGKGIASELSDLVNYFSAKRFNSFLECEEYWQFNEMASFQETVALNLGYTDGTKFVEYNRKHIARIYPKGTRTDSGNYDAIPYWNLGCQLVALNYQTWDEPLYLNEAKFAQNGRCGYVLKPKYQTDDVPYDPSKSPQPDQLLHIDIKVISAQFLPKANRASDGEVVDPYVSIKVFGHPLDLQKSKTKFISNNGFNPIWNQTLKFVLNAPEEAIFHFRVKNENLTSNELIGQYALPCSSMMEGYRHVHLEDTRGQRLERSTLFVYVQMTQKVQYSKTNSLK